MHHLIDDYLNYLAVEKGASRNTIEGYSRDLGRYAEFVAGEGVDGIDTEGLISFLASLQKEGLASNSVNRALAAIRGFYKYLLREKKVDRSIGNGLNITSRSAMSFFPSWRSPPPNSMWKIRSESTISTLK